jgi:hypothetical protein
MVFTGVVIGVGLAMISVMGGIQSPRMIPLYQADSRAFRPVQVDRAGQNAHRHR